MLGVALTTFALVAATVGVKTGNRAYANNMFRLRGKFFFFLINAPNINFLTQYDKNSGSTIFYCGCHGGWIHVVSI